MKTDDKLRDETGQWILTEKQDNFLHYHQVKLATMNIFQVKKNYLLIKKSWQNKLSLLETKLETKTIVNQGKNQIKTMKEHWR